MADRDGAGARRRRGAGRGDAPRRSRRWTCCARPARRTSASRRRRTCRACRASGRRSGGQPGVVPHLRRHGARRRQHGRAAPSCAEADLVALPDGADPVLVGGAGPVGRRRVHGADLARRAGGRRAGDRARRRRRGRAGRGPARPLGRCRRVVAGARSDGRAGPGRRGRRGRRRGAGHRRRRRARRPVRRAAATGRSTSCSTRCSGLRPRPPHARCAPAGGWSTWAAPPPRPARSTPPRCAAGRCGCSATPTTR